MKIREIMTENVICVGQNEPVYAAARLLKRFNIGVLPVCDDRGRLRGLVTDRDIVTRCIANGLDTRETKISDIMSRGVITAEPDDDVERAGKLMQGDQVRRIPVVQGGQLVGMVSLCDLARSSRCAIEASQTLTEISNNILRK